MHLEYRIFYMFVNSSGVSITGTFVTFATSGKDAVFIMENARETRHAVTTEHFQITNIEVVRK